MGRFKQRKQNEIKREKGLHRNIFHIKTSYDDVYNILVCTISLPFVYDIVINVFGYSFRAVFVLIIVAAVVLIVPSLMKKRNTLNPYVNSRHFIGLYSIEGSKTIKLDHDSGLISRNKEIKYLKVILEEIFGSPKQKRGICIAGASGCGKSTILNLLKKEVKKQYKFYNLSNKYDYMEDYLTNKFNGNYISGIKNVEKIL